LQQLLQEILLLRMLLQLVLLLAAELVEQVLQQQRLLQQQGRALRRQVVPSPAVLQLLVWVQQLLLVCIMREACRSTNRISCCAHLRRRPRQ
jgi:hypothetical protein